MFIFSYLASDILLIYLNVLLLKRMHFENIAWPIIAVAIPASVYLALIDLTVFYHWFGTTKEFIFSERILIYKAAIIAGLILSLIRIPVVRLNRKIRERTEAERLGGKD